MNWFGFLVYEPCSIGSWCVIDFLHAQIWCADLHFQQPVICAAPCVHRIRKQNCICSLRVQRPRQCRWRYTSGWVCKQLFRENYPLLLILLVSLLIVIKKRLKELTIIWQAVSWRIWLARNTLVFYNKESPMCDIVEAIKYTTLDWFIAKRYAGVCISYEWQIFPIDCLLR
jgi:hypothetical protein